MVCQYPAICYRLMDIDRRGNHQPPALWAGCAVAAVGAHRRRPYGPPR
jgi:hypothetical protein